MWPIFALYVLLFFSLVPPWFGYVTPNLFSWFYTCFLCYSHAHTHTHQLFVFFILYARACTQTRTHKHKHTHKHTQTHTQTHTNTHKHTHSVIALIKDVPDVGGDRYFEIKTLSVRLGAPAVSFFVFFVLF